jgi:hypothetical protein
VEIAALHQDTSYGNANATILPMSRSRLGRSAVYFALLSGVVLGQSKSQEPIKTTLCELVKLPERFAGMMIQVLATFHVGFEASLLADDSCSALIWLSWGEKKPLGKLEYAEVQSIKDLKAPELLEWKPLAPKRAVVLNKDTAFHRLDKYLGAQFKPKNPHELCVSCPLYIVSASVVGRFDHTDRKWRIFRGHDADKVPPSQGFGHLN